MLAAIGPFMISPPHLTYECEQDRPQHRGQRPPLVSNNDETSATALNNGFKINSMCLLGWPPVLSVTMLKSPLILKRHVHGIAHVSAILSSLRVSGTSKMKNRDFSVLSSP